MKNVANQTKCAKSINADQVEQAGRRGAARAENARLQVMAEAQLLMVAGGNANPLLSLLEQPLTIGRHNT